MYKKVENRLKTKDKHIIEKMTNKNKTNKPVKNSNTKQNRYWQKIGLLFC